VKYKDDAAWMSEKDVIWGRGRYGAICR